MSGIITLTPVSGTSLGADIVGTNLALVVSASIASEDGEVMSSVTITADITEPTAILTDGVTSATVTGHYTMDLFPGLRIKYLPPGGTDKVDPVTTVDTTAAVPDGQEVFSIIPDGNSSIVVLFTVIATGSMGTTAQGTYPYTVLQDYTGIQEWTEMYFDNYYGD